ncbi:MAG: hypothetical protein VSS75_004985 [Candidatus Parabeggiatoa sp.]|nr:hypothetical protein [Candidatus Parabeggiatoa sp.]
MTLYEILSLTISITGFVAVIISLLFVAKQTKMVSESLHESTLEHTMTQIFDLSRIFIEYPEIRKYFYSRKNIEESHTDFERVKAVSILILDTFDYYFVNKHLLSTTYEKNKARWELWIVDMFQNSPVLRKVYSESIEGYPNDIQSRYQIAQDGIP